MFQYLKSLFRCKKKKNTEHHEVNVVDSIVKAKQLYKQLIVRAHPDRNPNNIELAKSLSQQIVQNKFNYEELVKIKKIINEKL